MYKPKAAKVLRVLLKDVSRPWKVNELARAAGVSLGQVSNVRRAVIDREWASADAAGFHLTRPAALLDEWRDHYDPPPGKRHGLYTPLHGHSLKDAIGDLVHDERGSVALGSYSAAEWLAPYAKTPNNYVYVAPGCLDLVKSRLQAQPAARGENLFVTELADAGLLEDTLSPAPDVVTTGYAQTYLDLYQAGDRGREAAEHLRREKMPWAQ